MRPGSTPAVTRLAIVSWLLLFAIATPVSAHDGEHHPEEGKAEQGWPGSAKGQEVARAFLADQQGVVEADAQSGTACTDGFAGEYPCKNVDLLAFMPLGEIGGGNANDIWGWTDPASGREYALLGRTSGTSFVDITVPTNPVYLGNLPTTRFSSTWRDIKVDGNYAFIVSESRNHGMQVFDLTRLRSVTNPPVTFSADARYTGFATAHNIAINEDSGFAYAVGTNTCSGGLHIVDIRNPLNPTQAGCFSTDGYTHDVQCVNYAGPDAAYVGREICFASNEDTVTVVDVSDKAAPVQLARVSYPGVQYTHQGWLTDDQRYFLVDDELDEDRNTNQTATHTYVFDMLDVDQPVLVHTFQGSTAAIDHNQYVKGNYTYQSNYRAGLRIIDITNKSGLQEVGYFDVYPADDNTDFNGTWSNYPFFRSGVVIVSSIERGLFIVKPNLGATDAPPSVSIAEPAEGTTVSGSPVRVVADATDNHGVVQVEFFVDGVRIGVDTDGADGWTIGWNTTEVIDGDHALTAVATDTANQPTTSAAVTVTVDNVDEPPTAAFSYACTGLTCSFDASGSTDDRSISSYAWDFGDGTTGSGSLAQHTFAAAGTYRVTLTVVDANGASDTETQSVSASDATMHVGDLDGRRELKGNSGRWEVFVTATVHDTAHQPVSGATVTADWGGAASGTVSGTTASDGTVTFGTGALSGGSSVTFTVKAADHVTLTYDAGSNHDPDNDDSNGTTITVAR